MTVDSSPDSWRGTIVASLCVAANGAASLALLTVAPGTELEPDPARRAAFVADHVPLWRFTWILWMAASISLLAFFHVWADRLAALGAGTIVRKLTVVVGLGVVCDLSGETINIVALTRKDLAPSTFSLWAYRYQILGPILANGLYCVAGLAMSGIGHRTGFLRGRFALLGFLMWTVGMGLTVAALVDVPLAMVATGGAVMTLFLPWASIVAWRLRPRSSP